MKASLFKFSANESLKKEVDAVLARLREKLYQYTETLSVEVSREDEDMLVGYINEETYGHTLKERINTYTNRYKFEVEAFIASGLAFGYNVNKLLNTIRANLSAPYNNDLFRNTVIRGGMAATRIKTGGISYGQGHSNSARNLLLTLTRNTIGSAWMYFRGYSAYLNGSTGFYSFRGSSYPCAFCDDQTGYHPIQEYKGYWHLNCRCFFIFV